MGEVIYSYITNFPSGWNQSQFHKEIKNNISITTTFHGVNKDDDVIKLIFDSTPSAGEITILNNLVSSHVPNNTPNYKLIQTLIPHIESVNESSYIKITSFTYQGTDNTEMIQKCRSLSSMDIGMTNFSIRLFDATHDTVLGESTFTNTTTNINCIGSIANLPTNVSIIEVHVKTVGGSTTKKAHIDEISYFS